METNENTQVAPPAPAPSAAQTPEQLQARVVELEKQSEGRLRDLQSERQKRQEAEAKLNPPPAPSPEVQADVTQDELGKVLHPYLKPLEERAKRAEAFVAETLRNKALEFMSAKTGKSKEAIVEDKELDTKLTSIVKRYKLNGDVYDVTTRAWEILELENLKASEAERRRTEEARGLSSIPTGTHAPAKANAKEYSEEDFNAMPLDEYDKLSNEGSFLMNKEGKIVFTPHPK